MRNRKHIDSRNRVRIVFWDILVINSIAGIVSGIVVLVNITNPYGAIAGILITAVCGFIMVRSINIRHDLMYNDDDFGYMDDWD